MEPSSSSSPAVPRCRSVEFLWKGHAAGRRLIFLHIPKTAGTAIANYVVSQGLKVNALDVGFDGATHTVIVAGVVDDQATKEKVLLCCGNVAGVASVNDLLVVSTPAPEAQYHTVVSGDNLSKIAKKFYGDANKYPLIFEANKPMLSHPDKIYPGQMLRIPPQG